MREKLPIYINSGKIQFTSKSFALSNLITEQFFESANKKSLYQKQTNLLEREKDDRKSDSIFDPVFTLFSSSDRKQKTKAYK